jgi:hypothetical protein
MLDLPQITLVAMAGVNVFATVQALCYSIRDIRFGRTLLISHKKPWYLPANIDFQFTTKTKDIDEWCFKIIYELHEYIKTDYILLIHSDGYIVNPSQWRDEFFDFDYIGSPFPLPEDDFSYRDAEGNIVRVGNSVSLRSKRILELPSKLNFPWEKYHGFYNEDGFLCCKNKILLEKNSIRFAPLEVAKYFAHESMIPEIKGLTPFAFHRHEGSNSKYPNFETLLPLNKWLINQ